VRALIRAVVAIAVVAIAFGVSAAPAQASGTGGAWTNGEDVGAGAHDGGDTHAGGHAGAGSVTCRSERLTDQETTVVVGEVGIGLVPPAEGDGAWYRRRCYAADGTIVSADIVWRPIAVSAPALATDAWDVSRIPLPDINLNPGADRDQVVNVATWMWVDDWAPVSASASAGGVTVTVTATPTHVEWDMGDGTIVDCAGPGTPYDERRPADEQTTDCSHTYRRSSASQPDQRYRVDATSHWHVTWTSSTGESGDFGDVGRTSSIRVRVAEIQTVNG
jgi:hypothetical protein